MGSYELLIQPAARSDLWAIPFPFRRHLHQRMIKLRAEPHPANAEVKANGIRSLRLSYGRIDFDVDDDLRCVVILAIAGP
jgi:mRNA-degrading endonuclease RelE of RelBE toxin-antitoxin system